MKKILQLSILISVNSMDKTLMTEEINSLGITVIEKKEEIILSDKEKLNNVINYLNNLGNHTYTDHCPKISDSQKKIEEFKVNMMDLKDTIEDLKENLDTLENKFYIHTNSHWKCQII